MIANELRIGNWVLGHSYKMNFGYVPAKVTTIGPKQIQLDRANGGEINAIKPIPITEEVLLKCGFTEFGGGSLELKMDGDDSIYAHPALYCPVGLVWGIGSEGYTVENVLHLHQLQNLYFALTGQELTYTP